jgi:XTP/dITP diphosphohydrolase
MPKLYFVTSNRNKLREARKILGLPINQLKMKIVEPQLWSINEVSKEKAKQAYAAVKKPVFVEDTAIYIRGLKGFPGPFIYWVHRTIGNKGLLKLMKGVKDRKAEAKAVITYYNGKAYKQFVGSVKGRIAKHERGGGWGFDPIFIPQGYSKTYG